MNSLEVKGLDASYGTLQVLWDISIEVGAGKIAVVLGPNGAGKSTLFSAIAGVTTSNRGTVTVSGQDVTRQDSVHRLRSGLAWVPEGRNVFQHLTVSDNLRMSARLGGRQAEYEESVAMVVELFPAMGEKLTSLAGTLSGGQQQILAISRALVRKPDIALLDEPTIGLAPSIVERLGQAIAATKERGVSWVIAEQNLGWLKGIADSTYVLQGGRVVSSGGAEVIANRESIRRAYFENAEATAS